MAVWRNNNRNKISVYQKRYKKKMRMKVFNHYSGGNIKCACCGEKEIKFLTIDHINNNGAEQRRLTNSNGGHMYYHWIIKNNYPGGYQVLCFNCNMAKGHYGYCPHKPPSKIPL